MKNRVATRDSDRRDIEQVADVTYSIPVHQIRQWIIAHKLEAHRGCTGFRLDELGLSEVLPALPSSRYSLKSSS